MRSGRARRVIAFCAVVLVSALGPVSAQSSDPLQVILWASRTQGAPGLMVEFHALGSGGSPPYQYDWTFGDGSRVAGRDQNHTFFEPGTWMVQVTARDARGQLDADRSPISIVANPKTTTDLLLPGIVGFQTLLIVALLFLVGKKRRAVQTVRSEEASEKIEDVPAPDTGSPRPSDAPEVAKPETSAAANEPAAPASEDRTQGPPA